VNHTDLFCEADQPIQLKSTNRTFLKKVFTVFLQKNTTYRFGTNFHFRWTVPLSHIPCGNWLVPTM